MKTALEWEPKMLPLIEENTRTPESDLSEFMDYFRRNPKVLEKILSNFKNTKSKAPANKTESGSFEIVKTPSATKAR
jgi:hypothetical protein